MNRRRACRIISRPNSLLHNMTFNGERLGKWEHNGRRAGRPRMNWAEEAVEASWDYIKKDIEVVRYIAFDDSKGI